MDAIERIRAETERNRYTPEFEFEWLLLDTEDAIWDAMQLSGVSRSELAERLGTSRAFITKLLGGHENLTLKTLVRVANALQMQVKMQLVPRPATGKDARRNGRTAAAASRSRRAAR